MGNEIIYSVIIPHYNSIDKLNRLILSIPKREDLEILVIDDKSSDFDLTKINKRYNLKILINQTNKKGAGVCRNIGIDNSRGKWLIFADSDDFFMTGFENKLEEYKEDESDLVFFKVYSCYEDTGEIAKRHLVKNLLISEYLVKKEDSKKNRLLFKYQVPWGKFVKKEYIIKNDIRYSEIIASNDIYFSMMSSYYAKKIKVDSDILYCVTDSQSSLTKNISENIINTRLEETLKINNFLKSIDKRNCQLNVIVYLKKIKKFGIAKLLLSIKKIYLENGNVFAGITLEQILFLIKLKIIQKKRID